MKCPNCKTDGAYQPLMRQLECVNRGCKFFVEPPKKKIFYAIHSVDIKPNKNSDVYLPGTMKDIPEGIPVFLNGVKRNILDGITLPTEASMGEVIMINRGIQATSFMFDGVRWLQI